MAKLYYLRKNKIIQCRETGKKGAIKRVWYKPTVCSDGWTAYDIHADVISNQLEQELSEGRLTLIPEKVIEKNIEAWRKFNEKDKDETTSS